MQSFMESLPDYQASGCFSQFSFQCAPPKITENQKLRSAPTPPYKGAPGYKCSVYYYWWRFLKLSSNYYQTCKHDGRGPCAKLYQDFGDLYKTGFRNWWQERWHIFAEQPAVTIADRQTATSDPANILTIQLDLSRGKEAVIRSLEALHLHIHYPERGTKTSRSTARYSVFSRPILMTLHRQLQVYRHKTRDPDAADAEIADRVGITVNNRLEGLTERQLIKAGISTDQLHAQMRRAKNRVVQRDFRMACSLIKNAEEGLFPKTDTR